MLFEQLPPHDIEAEEGVIAACLLPEGWPHIEEVAVRVSPPEFFREVNGAAFDAIMTVHRRHDEVNQITVAREMAQRGTLEEFGGQARLMDYIRRLQVATAGTWYADLVRAAYRQRQIIHAATGMMQMAYEGKEPDDILDSGHELLNRIGLSRSRAITRSVGEILRGDGERPGLIEKTRAVMDNPEIVRGTPTGWELFDEIGGLRETNVYTILGDTSVGKSFFCHWLAWRVATNADPVGMVSTEMSQEEIAERLLFMQAGKDPLHIKALAQNGGLPDSYRRAIEAAAGDLDGAPIYITDVGRIPLATLMGEVRRLRATRGIVGVFVDHIQHVQVPRESGVELVQSVMGGLKALAMNEGIWVVAVSHINRTSAREGINMHSGKGGSAIEQDSNMVISLDPVERHSEGWAVLEEESAAAYQAQHNRQYVRATIRKGRAGGKGWGVRVLDWNQGGRWVGGE